MKNLLRAVFIVISVVLITVFLYSIFNGFDASLDKALEILGKSDKRDKAVMLLNPSRFFYAQIAVACLVMFFIILQAKADDMVNLIKKLNLYIKQAFISVLSDFKNPKAVLVLLIPVCSSFYFALTLPVTIDEAFTYINFSDKAFYVPLIYYPAPNNHVLHSILTNISVHLPFLDVLFKLRLPTIIASALLWMTAYSFIKRNYTERVAMFVVAIASMIFASVYYSYTSRGYALMMLMFIVALYAIYNIARGRDTAKAWALWCVSSVLGLYTIPIYVYPFFTLSIILVLFKFDEIKNLIKNNIFIVLVTILLYSPILLLNDVGGAFSQGTDNPDQSPFISHVEFVRSLPIFIKNIQDFIFGIPFYITLFFTCLAVALLIKKKQKRNLLVMFVFYATPLALHLIYPVIPLDRTFIYLGFITVLFIGVSFSAFLEKIPALVFFTTILLIQVFGFFSFSNKVIAYEGNNIHTKQTNDLILEEGKTYYMVYFGCLNDLIFEVKAKGFDMDKVLFFDYETKEASADTIYNYDYVILERKSDRTIERRPFYSNEYQNVYKK